MAKIVKNISDVELMIPNVGLVQPGAKVKVPDDFHNPNFVEDKPESEVQSGEQRPGKKQKA